MHGRELPFPSTPARAAPVALLFVEIGDLQEPAIERKLTTFLRDAAARHGGRLVAHQQWTCAAFAAAPGACSAAIEVRRNLRRTAIRMAIDIGHVDGTTVLSPCIARAKRMLARAHDGQILLSSAAAEPARMLDLAGYKPLIPTLPYTLRTLDDPDGLMQLQARGIRRTFPPLRALSVPPNNLPHYATSLVGRDTDLLQVSNLFGTSRLVSLVGTGGLGKTRLSIHVAWDLLERFAQGAVYVELADVSEPANTISAISSHFQIASEVSAPIVELVAKAIGESTLLLVLDNCEHVCAEVASICDVLLRHCPNLSILTTSRQAIGIGAEAVYHVPPLELPPDEGAAASSLLDAYSATRLFLERARQVDPTFTLDEARSRRAIEICRRLDGLAFAIELAASRVDAISVDQIADRLDERFTLLGEAAVAKLTHHQTLRALIDWSYDLLAPPERRLFARLAVFSGSWTLSSAAAVATDDVPLGTTRSLLQSLVEKSLVVQKAVNSEPRYRFLDSTREYALEKLAETGDLDRTRHRHARFYADLMDRSTRLVSESTEAHWIAHLAPELDNVRTALDWALEHARELAVRIVSCPTEFCILLTIEREWLTRLQAVISAFDADDPQTIPAWFALLRNPLLASTRCIEVSEHIVRIAPPSYDPVVLALTRIRGELGRARSKLPHDDAAVKAALATVRAKGTRYDLLVALSACGHISNDMADYRSSVGIYAECSKLAKKLGWPRYVTLCQINIAEAEFAQNHVERAIERIRRTIVELRMRDRRLNLGIGLGNLSAYAIVAGHSDEALGNAREAVTILLSLGAAEYAASAALVIALARAMRGDPETAARLLGHAEALSGRPGDELEPTERRVYRDLAATLHRQLPEEQLAQLRAEGAALDEQQSEQLLLATTP